MYVHLAPLALPLGIVAIEESAHAGATPMHYVAVGAVIMGIAAVVRGWSWVQHEVETKITAALKLHSAEEALHFEQVRSSVAQLTAALGKWSTTRPCLIGECKNRQDAERAE